METSQVRTVEQLAERMSLGQGEVMRVANEIAGEEVHSLYQLSREQGNALIVALESLVCVG